GHFHMCKWPFLLRADVLWRVSNRLPQELITRRKNINFGGNGKLTFFSKNFLKSAQEISFASSVLIKN
ncbi:MAG: hypothetical protein ABF513_09385, partial [Acetobacter malorum]